MNEIKLIISRSLDKSITNRPSHFTLLSNNNWTKCLVSANKNRIRLAPLAQGCPTLLFRTFAVLPRWLAPSGSWNQPVKSPRFQLFNYYNCHLTNIFNTKILKNKSIDIKEWYYVSNIDWLSLLHYPWARLT